MRWADSSEALLIAFIMRRINLSRWFKIGIHNWPKLASGDHLFHMEYTRKKHWLKRKKICVCYWSVDTVVISLINASHLIVDLCYVLASDHKFAILHPIVSYNIAWSHLLNVSHGILMWPNWEKEDLTFIDIDKKM